MRGRRQEEKKTGGGVGEEERRGRCTEASTERVASSRLSVEASSSAFSSSQAVGASLVRRRWSMRRMTAPARMTPVIAVSMMFHMPARPEK